MKKPLPRDKFISITRERYDYFTALEGELERLKAKPSSPTTPVQGRMDDYGHPLFNFGAIAHMLNGVLGYKLKVSITPTDVPLIMIAVKMARLAKTPHHEDSIIDINGYVECLRIILDPASREGRSQHPILTDEF